MSRFRSCELQHHKNECSRYDYIQSTTIISHHTPPVQLRSHQVRTSTAIRTVHHPAEAHDVHDAGGGARAHVHARGAAASLAAVARLGSASRSRLARPAAGRTAQGMSTVRGILLRARLRSGRTSGVAGRRSSARNRRVAVAEGVPKARCSRCGLAREAPRDMMDLLHS